jgi:chemotaxis response regulator CheB
MKPESPLQPSLPQTSSVPFDVVALVTSAGGLEALSAVLRDLPSPFPAAVIVAQHLIGKGRTWAPILGRGVRHFLRHG